MGGGLGGGLGGMGPLPPPPQLLKFRGALLALAAGYFVVLILGLVAGSLSSGLSYLFVFVAALLMALRAPACMGQCLMPFLLFAVVTLFFDVISFVSALS